MRHGYRDIGIVKDSRALYFCKISRATEVRTENGPVDNKKRKRFFLRKKEAKEGSEGKNKKKSKRTGLCYVSQLYGMDIVEKGGEIQDEYQQESKGNQAS